jgi:hypothetical protein
LNEKKLKKIVTKEIMFYDDTYFLKRTDPKLVFYYSGHAVEGMLLFSKSDQIFYDKNLLGHFAVQIEKQMTSLKNVKENKVIWSVDFYIDACHSGSCLELCKKWVIDNGGVIKEYHDLATFK